MTGLMDCDVCRNLLFEPVTTGCGHVSTLSLSRSSFSRGRDVDLTRPFLRSLQTFCRRCIARSLDHSPKCPLCRSDLPVTTGRGMAVNRVLQSIRESDPSLFEGEGDAKSKLITSRLLSFSHHRLPFRIRRSEARSRTGRTRRSNGYPDLRLHSRLPVHAYDSSRLRAKVRLFASISPSRILLSISMLTLLGLFRLFQISSHASSLHRIQLSSLRNGPSSSRVVDRIGSCRVRNDAGDQKCSDVERWKEHD